MPDDEASERRRAPRRRTLKGAKIIYSNFAVMSECTVRNLSETGARLKIDPEITIPNEFHLLMSGELAICRARIAWRRGDEIGIEFLEPMRNPKLDPDPRISRLAF